MTHLRSRLCGITLALATLGGCSNQQQALQEQSVSKESALSDFLLAAEKAEKNHVILNLCENKGKWTVSEKNDANKKTPALCAEISCDRVENVPAIGAPESKEGGILVRRKNYGWVCGNQNQGDGGGSTVPGGVVGGGTAGGDPAGGNKPGSGGNEEPPPVAKESCGVVRPMVACAFNPHVEFTCRGKSKTGKEFVLKGDCEIDLKYDLIEKACQEGESLEVTAVSCTSADR